MNKRMVYCEADIENGSNDEIRPLIPNYYEWKIRNEYNNTMLSQREANELLTKVLGSIGKDVVVRQPFYFDVGENIHIGDHSFLNFDCMLTGNGEINIGERVLIAPRVMITTVGHPIAASFRYNKFYNKAPVNIGNDVWIGIGAIILPGVNIGDRAIIGAGSIVIHDVEEDTVVAGNPARVIRNIDQEESESEELLLVKSNYIEITD